MSEEQSTSKRSARERLLETADRLFYEEGVHAVGIDRILAESGVAKGSLYYNFAGKDDLVRTYLMDRHGLWAARLDQEIAGATTPTAKILAIYEALADLFAKPEFRGCAFLNAAAEAAPGSAADLATKEFRTWIHGLFETLVEQGGYRSPSVLTGQLIMLYDGANISAQLDHDPGAASGAKTAAAALLIAASPS